MRYQWRTWWPGGVTTQMMVGWVWVTQVGGGELYPLPTTLGEKDPPWTAWLHIGKTSMKSDLKSRHIAARCPPGSAGHKKAICGGLKNSLSWVKVYYSGLGIISCCLPLTPTLAGSWKEPKLTLCHGSIEGSTKHAAWDSYGSCWSYTISLFWFECHLSVV